MSTHPAISPGNVAVVTGGGDGIGLAAATFFHGQGLKIVLADVDDDKLKRAAETLDEVLTVVTDVSDLSSVQALKDKVYARFGRVDVLMNNAGVASHCTSTSGIDAWKTVLDVNLWGVIHGVHTFVPAMQEQGTPGLIINTGSKQGITTPPGNPAYNVSKAGVKAVTEALQHELRSLENNQLSAHLLVPGFTYTGMVRDFLPEKPDSAWTAEQVVQYMTTSLERGDFYIICPDNDVTEAMDKKRMAWAMGDLIDNRPPLSRWHPDYADAFNSYMEN